MKIGVIDCDKKNSKNPFPNLALMKKGHELKKLQRWVNNRFIWESTETFEDYLKGV